jgi:deoxyribonuclease V
MKTRALHPWNVTYAEAVTIQQELKKKLILRDSDISQQVRTIAGADISYSRGDDLFFAAVIVCDFPALNILETATYSKRVTFPYIPGLLTFREGPALIEAFNKLENIPDVVIFDGHGIAHPRGMGLASHMGLLIDIPSIGCAKKRLTGTYEEPGTEVGDYTCLELNGSTIGAVLRTKKNVKPVFVSQGHKIGLTTAIDIVLSSCTRYRLAEPVRRAHLEVNRMRMEHGGRN